MLKYSILFGLGVSQIAPKPYIRAGRLTTLLNFTFGPFQQEAELLDALDEADREKGISAKELFTRLGRFG